MTVAEPSAVVINVGTNWAPVWVSFGLGIVGSVVAFAVTVLVAAALFDRLLALRRAIQATASTLVAWADVTNNPGDPSDRVEPAHQALRTASADLRTTNTWVGSGRFTRVLRRLFGLPTIVNVDCAFRELIGISNRLVGSDDRHDLRKLNIKAEKDIRSLLFLPNPYKSPS